MPGHSGTGLSRQDLDLLACPVCHGDLVLGESTLRCDRCRADYPIEDGIPNLLPTQLLEDRDLRISLARWNDAWRQIPLPPTGDIEAEPAYAASLGHIRRHAPATPYGAFLEAGCGGGKVSLVMAREQKIPVVGVDLCLEACRLARRLFAREGENGLFVVGDLRHLPLRSDRFGYIYAGGSLEHFADTLPGVAEAYRVLKPGGKLTATVPVVSLATLTYRQLWGNIPEWMGLRAPAEWVHLRLLGGRHLRWGYEKSFSPGGFRRYLRRVGFVRLRSGRLATPLDLTFLAWEWLRQVARWLERWRWFWAMMWVDGEKPS